VQLSLPGADPLVAAAIEADGAQQDPAALDAGADEDDDQDTMRADDADSGSPRPQGLVASGTQDDSN
jgi:hypothetical protein